MQDSRVLKSAGRRGCLTEKQETLPPARALRVTAAAQFHRRSGRDPETHCVSPPARDGTTKTRAARTAKGQRPPGGRGGRWPL
jgi:hypothetical protein